LIATNFLKKVAQIFGDFLTILKGITLKVKTIVVYFGQRMEQIGLLFISTCGHTDQEQMSSTNLLCRNNGL